MKDKQIQRVAKPNGVFPRYYVCISKTNGGMWVKLYMISYKST